LNGATLSRLKTARLNISNISEEFAGSNRQPSTIQNFCRGFAYFAPENIDPKNPYSLMKVQSYREKGGSESDLG
jgi:hypothetical protein